MNHTIDPLQREMILEAERVSFGYSTPLLRDINLELRSGSTLAIMGPSGSGKSTLLQLLAGILKPASGDIRLAGQRLGSLNARALAELRLRKVGFVFQFGEMLPELTLQENVELPALFAGERREASRRAAQDLLELVGLANERDRFLYQVSGGQLQRAAVARALVQRPGVIFADEPTGALDGEAAQDVLHLLLDTAPSQGAGVVVVTHSESVARRCDRILRLAQGTLENAA